MLTALLMGGGLLLGNPVRIAPMVFRSDPAEIRDCCHRAFGEAAGGTEADGHSTDAELAAPMVCVPTIEAGMVARVLSGAGAITGGAIAGDRATELPRALAELTLLSNRPLFGEGGATSICDDNRVRMGDTLGDGDWFAAGRYLADASSTRTLSC